MDETARRTRPIAVLSASTVAFLRRYPPFHEMEDNPDALRYAAEHMQLGYYPKGDAVLAPENGTPDYLYIVQRGLVQVAAFNPNGSPARAHLTLGPGECFSLGALLEQRPVTSAYIAAADTFCYQLPAAQFTGLMHRSPRFQDFATGYLASLLRASRKLLKMQSASGANEQQTMNRPLRSMLRRTPLTCSTRTSIHEALRAMHEENVGSIVIVSEEGAPAGIFTRHDALDRVALAKIDTEQPISDVMTTAPQLISADASAYDAALLMAERGVRHLPVIEEERVIGVVAEHDLFTLQRVSMRHIHRTIKDARERAALIQAAGDIRKLASNMLHQGFAAEQLTQIISALNDALTRRIIELEGERQAISDIEWCWLAFGSEGRLEQTLASDQDNGIIFRVPNGASADELRRRLLPVAKEVNRTLDACGYPLCTGEIMAGNPRWCLSLAEWGQQFASWIRDPEPEALLNATIFFDFRALFGAEDLAETLRKHLVDLTRDNSRFFRMMAQHALKIEPPLGLLRDFVLEDEGEYAGTIDLKRRGARLFVDAARVIGLATAVAHTGTAARLRLGGARIHIAPAECDAVADAFYFIQLLRLRGGAGEASNHLDPATLNEVDRRILKECFRQARRVQTRVRLDYQL
jgi:CBS domain-containing protein